MALLFLNGGGMRGGPLHDRLEGAPLVATVRTAARYRLHSVGDRFPAMEPVPSTDNVGVAVLGELYDIPLETLGGSLLPGEPPELELSVIELADGAPVLGFVLRKEFTGSDELKEVAATAGTASWREHLATLGRTA